MARYTGPYAEFTTELLRALGLEGGIVTSLTMRLDAKSYGVLRVDAEMLYIDPAEVTRILKRFTFGVETVDATPLEVIQRRQGRLDRAISRLRRFV